MSASLSNSGVAPAKCPYGRERGTPVLFCSASFSSFRDFFLFLPKIRGGGAAPQPLPLDLPLVVTPLYLQAPVP